MGTWIGEKRPPLGGVVVVLVAVAILLGLSNLASAGDRFEKFKTRTKARFPKVSWISVETLDQWM